MDTGRRVGQCLLQPSHVIKQSRQTWRQRYAPLAVIWLVTEPNLSMKQYDYLQAAQPMYDFEICHTAVVILLWRKNFNGACNHFQHSVLNLFPLIKTPRSAHPEVHFCNIILHTNNENQQQKPQDRNRTKRKYNQCTEWQRFYQISVCVLKNLIGLYLLPVV